MKLQSTRLFINNLQNNINEKDLQEKFSNYGSITSIEIKERKNPVGKQTSHFSYITLDIENKALQECLREFSNTKWMDFYVDVQVARESFMERLKREREENAAAPSTTKEFLTNGTSLNHSVNNSIEPLRLKVKSKDPKSNKQSVSIPEKNEAVETIERKKQKVEDVHTLDNAKRLQSLHQMKEGYRQQKQLIKNALSNIEAVKSNKIVFDDAIAHDSKVQKSAPKLTLFEDDGDDEDYNFQVREELQGEKGIKLMELQSRFKNDPRFKMDARFLDGNEEGGEEENFSEIINDEKEKQMEILESVLGQKLRRHTNKMDAQTSKQPTMMLRFDPSQPDHAQYEVQPSPVENKKQKQKTKKIVDVPEVAPPPEVSKETFYTVESDLKQALYGSEGFSLSKLFGDRVEETKEVSIDGDSQEKPIRVQKQTQYDANPFKYDSSDDEDKEETLITEPIAEKVEKFQVKPRLWTETLFFKEDDYRLQEGYDFIKRLQLGEQENFQTVRRNLKEIIRAKVKNNLRKNRPFKRKLGGNKKRIQVKKALKR